MRERPRVLGYTFLLDIEDCSEEIIESKSLIQEFVIQLCKLTECCRLGDISFAENEHAPVYVSSYRTLIFNQITNKGDISGIIHLDERVFLLEMNTIQIKHNCFDKVADLSIDFFKGEKETSYMQVLERGIKEENQNGILPMPAVSSA